MQDSKNKWSYENASKRYEELHSTLLYEVEEKRPIFPTEIEHDKVYVSTSSYS